MWRAITVRRSNRPGGGRICGCSLSAALICWKIHGFPSAARPTITASQPVCSSMWAASAGVHTSPLPTTGMCTASFTRRMISQSAGGV